MKFSSHGADETCFGNHRKSTRLAAVSVMIFTVLIMANFRALFSWRSFANNMAVMESRVNIPPIYFMQAP